MKRRDLINQITELAHTHGVTFEEDGGTKHEKYRFNGKMVPIPRHREIGEMLAREILKQCKSTLGGN